MKVAIVGSRDYRDMRRVREYLETLDHDTVIVTGCAIGVDAWARSISRTLDMRCEVYTADWQKHGRAAGPLRNTEIVSACDRLVAFWDGKSRGTADSIAKAKAAGKPVMVILAGESACGIFTQGDSK